MTTQEIANKIRESLELGFTKYFTVEDSKGNDVKIRIGDHSANKNNNSGRTLSFISERSKQRKSAYNQMVDEWAILENGLTDTYEEIESVLEYELGF